MKSRWWIASSLVLALALLFQAGCGGPAELPTNDAPDEVVDDLMTGDEGLEGGGTGAGDTQNVDP